MKKLLAALLALMMIISLSACSGKQTDEMEAEAIEITPERGTVENGFYNNEAFGVSFETPADWYFLTDEEIAQTMGSTAEKLYGENILEDMDYIYDLYCVDMETGTTVSVNYENLGTIGQFTETNQYLETVLAQLLSSSNTPSSPLPTNISSGLSEENENKLLSAQKEIESGNTATELSVIKVDGTAVPCLNITLEASGQTIYESIIVKKIGTWIGTVTLATLDEAEIETLAESISFN